MMTTGSETATLPTWRQAPWAPSGRFEGEEYGSEVSFFVVSAAVGEGPELHRHAYTETFVVLAGRGAFTRDERELVAAAGDVVVVPAGTAHRFRSLGPGRLRLVAIHAAPRIEQTWLE
jgi:mannose-6-phosphate isomerase-like protein (cupin superfamily)